MTTSPEKAALYKTARLTDDAIELLPDAKETDGFVKIEFERVQFNVKYGVHENLFRVFHKGEFRSHFFERALTSFCL